jgi:DnaJ homolog subfamily C member 19
MTQEEAYQVLGLQPGASEAEIRAAHHRLMRTAHPDSGGSDWLATRVNQARDVLLRRTGPRRGGA